MPILIKYGREVAILALILCFLISTQRCNTERAERIRIQEEAGRAGIINKVEAGKQEIKNREENLYPAIDDRLRKIEGSRKDLKAKESEISPVSRKEIESDVQKSDIDALAAMFQRDGYPCSVLVR